MAFTSLPEIASIVEKGISLQRPWSLKRDAVARKLEIFNTAHAELDQSRAQFLKDTLSYFQKS